MKRSADHLSKSRKRKSGEFEADRSKAPEPVPATKRAKPTGDEEEEEEEEVPEEEEEVADEEVAIPAPKKSFSDLGLIDSLSEACTALGYKEPTEIQQQAIPLALERDLIGIAETGSGKTAAFALPVCRLIVLCLLKHPLTASIDSTRYDDSSL